MVIKKRKLLNNTFLESASSSFLNKYLPKTNINGQIKNNINWPLVSIPKPATTPNKIEKKVLVKYSVLNNNKRDKATKLDKGKSRLYCLELSKTNGYIPTKNIDNKPVFLSPIVLAIK